jgi:protein ImuA
MNIVMRGGTGGLIHQCHPTSMREASEMAARRLTTNDASLRQLAKAIEEIEGQRRPRDERPASSGFAAVDRMLPEGGFSRGAIVEYLATGNGSGAGSLALAAAVSATAAGGVLVVVDRERMFYPRAAEAWSSEAWSGAFERMLVVRPENENDERWALDQALRCPAVAAALAWPSSTQGKDFRRWQLAAESGGSLGFFVRPDSVRGDPSWAEARLAVTPKCGGLMTDEFATNRFTNNERRTAPRRVLQVELLKCRGRAGGTTAEVAIGDETHPMPVVTPVVAAVPRKRA